LGKRIEDFIHDEVLYILFIFYEKEIKDLKVPDKPNPTVVVLTVVEHAAIVEVHVPAAGGRVL